MTKFQDLVAANPELQQQYQAFLAQQSESGQTQPGQAQSQGRGGKPNWVAFRKYMQDQGKPDPGDEPEDLEAVQLPS